MEDISQKSAKETIIKSYRDKLKQVLELICYTVPISDDIKEPITEFLNDGLDEHGDILPDVVAACKIIMGKPLMDNGVGNLFEMLETICEIAEMTKFEIGIQQGMIEYYIRNEPYYSKIPELIEKCRVIL